MSGIELSVPEPGSNAHVARGAGLVGRLRHVVEVYVDLATLIGLIGCLSVIGAAIVIGPNAIIFVNLPGLLIVLGGTFMATLIKFPLAATFGGFKVAVKAFFHKSEKPDDLIKSGIELANIARKGGLLALEDKKVNNDFLQQGIQLCVDGHDPQLVRRLLVNDINLTIERHDEGQAIFKAIADVAPAMGMIGTLVGLVQMLSNMDDPKKIGPAMAVALLTTLYGAIIANTIAIPIAEKLARRSKEERSNKSLILETVAAIQEGLNPHVMEDLLKTYLPVGQRKPKKAA